MGMKNQEDFNNLSNAIGKGGKKSSYVKKLQNTEYITRSLARQLIGKEPVRDVQNLQNIVYSMIFHTVNSKTVPESMQLLTCQLQQLLQLKQKDEEMQESVTPIHRQCSPEDLQIASIPWD